MVNCHRRIHGSDDSSINRPISCSVGGLGYSENRSSFGKSNARILKPGILPWLTSLQIVERWILIRSQTSFIVRTTIRLPWDYDGVFLFQRWMVTLCTSAI